MKARVLLALAMVACSSCSGGSSGGGKPNNEQAALGGEAAARVGGESIPLSLVAKVAAEQRVTPNEALRRLVDDAISASGARSRGLDRAEPAVWLLSAARARWIADQLMAEARAAGPPTKDEIEELTKLHADEVSRPVGYKVVHAIAMPHGPADAPRAKAVAELLRQAVVGAKDENDFKDRAKAVPHPDDINVRVESLPPFAADGSSIGPGGAMVEPFARGAAALTKPGETSGIVESKFGFHVIRLLEILPEQRMSYEARSAAFTEEAYMRRAHDATEARLKAIAASTPVAMNPAAEMLLESLNVNLIENGGPGGPGK